MAYDQQPKLDLQAAIKVRIGAKLVSTRSVASSCMKFYRSRCPSRSAIGSWEKQLGRSDRTVHRFYGQKEPFLLADKLRSLGYAMPPRPASPSRSPIS